MFAEPMVAQHGLLQTLWHRRVTVFYDVASIDFCELVITMSIVNQNRVIETPPFTAWLAGLEDQVGKGAIVERIERIKKGLFGAAKSLTNAPGVYELVVDVGPGYRVYYTQAGNTVVLLLLGGNKSTQKADIKKAARMVADMVAQQKAVKKKREEEEEAAKVAEKASSSKTKLKRK